jgi:hypothetical protein
LMRVLLTSVRLCVRTHWPAAALWQSSTDCVRAYGESHAHPGAALYPHPIG